MRLRIGISRWRITSLARKGGRGGRGSKYQGASRGFAAGLADLWDTCSIVAIRMAVSLRRSLATRGSRFSRNLEKKSQACTGRQADEESWQTKTTALAAMPDEDVRVSGDPVVKVRRSLGHLRIADFSHDADGEK
jgi:hypothetical protein